MNGEDIILRIYDTAGVERFDNPIHRSHFNGVDFVIIAYDCSEPRDLESLPVYLNAVLDNCEEDIGIALVGTKCDL